MGRTIQLLERLSLRRAKKKRRRSTMTIDIETFNHHTSSNSLVDIDTMYKFIDPDRSRWWLERMFTPRGLRRFLSRFSKKSKEAREAAYARPGGSLGQAAFEDVALGSAGGSANSQPSEMCDEEERSGTDGGSMRILTTQSSEARSRLSYRMDTVDELFRNVTQQQQA